MNEQERAALSALRFNWAPVPDDVWRPMPFHVDGLHPAVVRDVLDGVADARASDGGSPIGLVLQGQRGSGKTHLLGWVRQQVQETDGYFFLVGLLDAAGFWDSVLSAMLDGLSRPVPGSKETQLVLLLQRLSAMVGAPRKARRAVMGEIELSRESLDAFIEGLGAFDRQVARASQDTARALALSASEDVAHRDLAENYFLSGEESEPGERAAWGMRRTPRRPQQIVQDLSWLLALTGPSVIAIDQIDTLIAQSSIGADPQMRNSVNMRPEQAFMLSQIADGLMALRQGTRRTLTVVACIPDSWTSIKTMASDTVADRFRLAPHLAVIKDDDLGRAIIEKRFAVRYGEIGFTPPYPSWPVLPQAFASAGDYTPRQLLIEIDTHIRKCIADDEVRELDHLGRPPATEPHEPRLVAPVVATDEMERFDALFGELKKNANVVTALQKSGEDGAVPGLLAAGLTAWILERGAAGEAFTVDPPPSTNPPLHARLRLTLDETTEDQVHWCFRAISDGHHGNAALSRLRKACMATGLDQRVAKRKLFVLRNGGWSGPATLKAIGEFQAAGGQVLQFTNDDVRALSALQTMIAEESIDLQSWLADRRPTRDVQLLREALADADDWPTVEKPAPEPSPTPSRPAALEPAASALESPTITAPKTNISEISEIGVGMSASVGRPAAETGPVPHTDRAPASVGSQAAPTGPAPHTSRAPASVGSQADPTGPAPHTDRPPASVGSQTAPTGPAPHTSRPPASVGSQAAPTGPAPHTSRPPASVGSQAAPAGPAPHAGNEGVGGAASFTIGYGYDSQAPIPLGLESLRKHMTIFAGSGSGKTVLIRRIVEECALQGVSSIVLDPNNDLARLGEGWPEPPEQWRAGDAAKAADYLANTDVVVWTPRRAAGRPLSFQPLPDFRSVLDDPDEFSEAVEAAVASLAPRALVVGRATKAHLGLAVLRKAVEHYGRRGGIGLKGLIDTLSTFPDGIIDLDGADKIALGLAQTLTAAMVNDPLFGGEGTPMDAGTLLTPEAGKRARISVISLIGLQSDDVRQSFVNQLQMALFAWIKKNPAGDRPLLGLLVMDEAQTFAPSGAMTACTQSTLALAAQARKYGLGLIFATQAPKGLHNRIPGNAATQLYGLLNSPIQIEAAREMAKAKGGDVPDVSRLTVGEFYLAAEGAAPAKVRTSLSLTHHPRSPLTVEEVLRVAGR